MYFNETYNYNYNISSIHICIKSVMRIKLSKKSNNILDVIKQVEEHNEKLKVEKKFQQELDNIVKEMKYDGWGDI